MAELSKLLARVEAATGADRILDAMIAADVAGLCLHGSWHSEGPDGDRGRVCDDCGADSWGNLGKFGQRLNDPLPAYTASIDATVALAEKLLPANWGLGFFKASYDPRVGYNGEGRYAGEVWHIAPPLKITSVKTNAGPAAAILAALLRALIVPQDAVKE